LLGTYVGAAWWRQLGRFNDAQRRAPDHVLLSASRKEERSGTSPQKPTFHEMGSLGKRYVRFFAAR
jgi:hypothetical protein